MTATVTHQPKAGATLTGTEYEASDHHVVTIAAADIGAAPTTADYLVGTANGDLSAEIVVGTTPGGELGGTWASPTVDATHSGSSHAGVQAAAEATAAAALAAASFAAPATSVTVQTASAVVWAAFTVKKPVTVSNVLFRVGVSAGNMDIGLCSVSGSTATRLASTGSFAVPAVAVQNTKALGASVDLIPGTIYLQALAADDVTAGFGGNNLAAMPMQNGSYYDLVGLTAASFPLPASFTLGSTATGKIHCLQFT